MGGAGGACKFLGMFFILNLLLQGTCAAQANNGINTDLNNSINGTINGTIIGNFNGTISDFNETLNGTTNETFNGTVVGTINGTFNGTISETEIFPSILLLPLFLGALLFLFWLCRFFDRMNFCFVSFLLIALLLGFLCCSRLSLIDLVFEDILYSLIFLIFILLLTIIFYENNKRRKNKELNFHFVSFLLIALLMGLLWRFKLPLINLILGLILIFLVFIVVTIFSVFRSELNEQTREDKNTEREKNIKTDEKSEKVKNNLIMWLHDIARNYIIIFVVLAWPITLLYFDYMQIKYIAFYGTEKLQFPVYIIAASYIGVLSYLFLSIEDRFVQLLPEYIKISIAWSYLKRILTAPFIALIGFYLLNHLLRIQEVSEINDYFVFVFSFFAGVFTKAIEKWIFAWVQDILPGDKKEQFESRIEFRVGNSPFVTKLGIDEDLAYMLYSVKIRTIEDLAIFYHKERALIEKIDLDTRNLGEGIGCPVRKREEMLSSYREEQLRTYTKRANYYTKIRERNELVKILGIDGDLAFKLCMRAYIKDLNDLKNCNPKYVHIKICDHKTESLDVHNRLCECPEELIQSYKERAQVELEKHNNPVASFFAYPVPEKHPLHFKFLDKSTGNPITWKWDFGDGTRSTDRNPEHKYSNAGKYTVTLEVHNEKGIGIITEEIEVK